MPRWETPRTPSRKTLGHRVARVAELLRLPPMPHQQQIWNVGLEIDPDTGVFAYREVNVTMMRQSGKTTTVLSLKLDRGMNFVDEHGPQRIQYSAQTGKDGREKMLDDEWPLIKRSKLRPAFLDPRRTNGAEAFRLKNGSLVLNLASDDASGHGKTTDLGIIDEAFADVDDRREQAIIPAMATKPWAQLWVASTAGTMMKSPYLLRKVEKGRAAVENGTGTRDGIAYFEWSIPDDEDIDSPDVWERFMPAFGLTINAAAIRHARGAMVEGEFRRAWCNQWTVTNERVLPVEHWEAVCRGDIAPTGRLTFAVDATPELSSAAVVVCDGFGRLEVVDSRSGVGWLTAKVVELAHKHGAAVAVDTASTANGFADEWERQGVEVKRLTSREMAGACGTFYAAVINHTIQIRTDLALNRAAAGARKRHSGDVWYWGRKDNTVDVSPLVAASIARWVAVSDNPPMLYAY